MPGKAWVEEHRIRGYEVGPDQKTTITTMANLLQVLCLLPFQPAPARGQTPCMQALCWLIQKQSML